MTTIHPAVYAGAGVLAAAAAVVALLLSGPSADPVDTVGGPVAPPSAGTPSGGTDGFVPLDPDGASPGGDGSPAPGSGGGGDDTLDPDGHDDRNEGGDVDVSAHEAAAAEAASAWLAFRSDESAAARSTRLASAGFVEPGKAPEPRSMRALEGQVSASAVVELVSIDLVAFSSQDGDRWTFSVLATTATTFTQPGSSRTEANRVEVEVTIAAGDPAAVLHLIER